MNPNVILATKTIAAINEALEKDQGARYRGFLGKVLPHIGDAYRDKEEYFRGHMGASQLGHECGRAIWYGWRWYTKSDFPGRILRLFNRGHLEEGRFISLLLLIDCQIYQQDANGKQFRIEFGQGHGGGSTDGIAIGLPDLPPGTPALTEFKTHNEKSFRSLKEKGVKESKYEHWVQMQLYMRKLGLAVALYLAVNKNDDDLYGEIIYLNSEVADQFLDRGEKLLALDTPPTRVGKSAGYFVCKWCSHAPVCWNRQEPHRNCRTCKFSEPRPGKLWHCKFHDVEITEEAQLLGCAKHEFKVQE